MAEIKGRDSEGLQRQANLEMDLQELITEGTPLLRRAEIVSSLRERFDLLVASQQSHAFMERVVPSLCQARSTHSLPPLCADGLTHT